MLLNKTDKAREALRQGPASGLGLAERRILILTDGKRSLNDVMALLGPGILPAIDRMLREGYIGEGTTAGPTGLAPTLGGALTGLVRAATVAVQAHATQVLATTPVDAAPARAEPVERQAPAGANPTAPSIPAAPRAGTRRSLVAAKMYLLDMLQLQRSPEAIELRAEIQCCAGNEALVEAMLRALRLLLQASTPSYGQRVAARLAEVLPEEVLPRLETIRSEHAGAPTLSIVAA